MTHVRNIVSIALIIPVFIAVHAAGQGTCPDPLSTACPNDFQCDPVDASAAKYYCGSGENCYVPIASPEFTPDRRPVFWLSMFCGCRSCDGTGCSCVYEDFVNPKGHAKFWLAEAWEDDPENNVVGFETLLEAAWDAGFRRIVLNRPGGHAVLNPMDGKVPQAMYEHLTAGQKLILKDDLRSWIQGKHAIDPDFEVGVFIGAWQSGSPCTPCNQLGDGGAYWDCDCDEVLYDFTFNFRMYNPRSQSSMQEVYQNLVPWLGTGCSAIWLDNSSNPSPSGSTYAGSTRMFHLVQSPDYNGVKIGGEAIPSNPANTNEIDPVVTQYTAWWAGWHFVKDLKGWHAGGAHEQVVNPDTTELAVLFRNPNGTAQDPPYNIRDVAGLRDNGFLMWADITAVGFVQRLYDGDDDEFYDALVSDGCIADFNLDGCVDSTDLCDFGVQFELWPTLIDPPLPAVWDGDIDNDDDVDDDDVSVFYSLWLNGCRAYPSCPVGKCYE